MNVDTTHAVPKDEREELILKWLPLAVKIAHRHFRNDTRFPPDEREGEALKALCVAADKFDPTRGFSFGSYMGRVVWDYLRKAAYKRGHLLTRRAIANRDPDSEGTQVSLDAFDNLEEPEVHDCHRAFHGCEEFNDVCENLEDYEIHFLKCLLKGMNFETIGKELIQFDKFERHRQRGRVSQSVVGRQKRLLFEKLRERRRVEEAQETRRIADELIDAEDERRARNWRTSNPLKVQLLGNHRGERYQSSESVSTQV